MLSAGRLGAVLRGTRAPPSSSTVSRRCLRVSASRPAADESERPAEPPHAFDPALLEFLVCPLSKKPLRYEASTNELINDELGIAYPIIDGIPNMIPQAARMMAHQNKKQEAGLFYSASVEEDFPQGCTSTASLCFYSLLLPITIPVYVFFHLWTWMGIKLFRHN